MNIDNDSVSRRDQPGEANVNGGTGDVSATADPLAQAESKAAEYLDLLQRERASFVNYRRRMEQERAEWQQHAGGQLLKKLLPLVDDFERALAGAPSDDPWVAGVRLIERKLRNLLEQEGVTPVEAVGKPFDPNLHEAVAYEGGEGEDVVLEEFARGYKQRDRVLRPAMVKVGKRPASQDGQTQEGQA